MMLSSYDVGHQMFNPAKQVVTVFKQEMLQYAHDVLACIQVVIVSQHLYIINRGMQFEW